MYSKTVRYLLFIIGAVGKAKERSDSGVRWVWACGPHICGLVGGVGLLRRYSGGGVAHICQLSSTCADEEGVKHAGNKR